MKVLSFILFLVCFSGRLYAEDLDYSLSSNLSWRSDGDLIPGELDNYTLVDDNAVKALLGIKEGASFFQEVATLKDEDIKSRFINEAKNFDPLNGFKDRKLSRFTVLREEGRIRIVLNYDFTRDASAFHELNVFDVQPNGAGFATLMIPQTASIELQNSLQKDLATFELIAKKQSGQPSDRKIHAYLPARFIDSVASLAAQQLYRAISGASLVAPLGTSWATPAWASEAESCEAERSQYISDGNWSDKEGSATFKFEQLVRDLKQEARNKQTKTAKFSCLSKVLNESMQNSVKYWRNRGLRTGCITESGFPEKKPAECSEVNWQKLNNNIQYFDRVRSEILSLTTKESRRSSQAKCDTKNRQQNSDFFMTIHGELERSRVRTCCFGVDETPLQNSQLGPLAQVINSDARLGFSKWTPEARFNECLSRTRETKQEFFSKDGIGSCTENAFHGAVQALKAMWSGLTSIFTYEGRKQIWHFITNLPESGARLVAMIGEHISRDTSAVTQCMNSYQKAQYTCQLVGSIASSILGPRYILKFLKLIATSSSVTELKALIAEAAEANPASKATLDVARRAKDSFKNAKEKAGEKLNTLLDNPTGEGVRKVSSILTSDINAPMRELLGRAATSAASASRTAAAATANAARATFKKLTKQNELNAAKELTEEAAKSGAGVATTELAQTTAVKAEAIKTTSEQVASAKVPKDATTAKTSSSTQADPTAQTSTPTTQAPSQTPSQNRPIANNKELKTLRSQQSSLEKTLKDKPPRKAQSLNDLKKRAGDVQKQIAATQRLARFEKTAKLKEKAKQTLRAARDFFKSLVGEIAKRELSTADRDALLAQRRYLDDLDHEMNPTPNSPEPIDTIPPTSSTFPKPTAPEIDPTSPQFPHQPDPASPSSPIGSSSDRGTILDPTRDSSMPSGDSSRTGNVDRTILRPSPRASTPPYSSGSVSSSTSSTASSSFGNPTPTRAPTWQNTSGAPTNSIAASGAKESGKTAPATGAAKPNTPMKPEAPPATPKDVGVNGEFDPNVASDVRKQISQEPTKARTSLENELEDLNIEAQNLSVGISVGGYSDLIKAKMRDKLKKIEDRRATIDRILDEGEGRKSRRHKKYEAPKEFVARPSEQRTQLVNNYTRIIRGAGLAYFAEEIQRLSRQEAELRGQRDVARKADLNEPGNKATLDKIEMQLQQSVDAIASLKDAKTAEESRLNTKKK